MDASGTAACSHLEPIPSIILIFPLPSPVRPLRERKHHAFHPATPSANRVARIAVVVFETLCTPFLSYLTLSLPLTHIAVLRGVSRVSILSKFGMTSHR